MSARSAELELIDQEAVQGEPLRRMLHELAVINRFLGGTACTLRALGEHLPRGQDWTFLDVATGGADLPRACRRWSCRRGGRALVVGSDRSLGTLHQARRRGARRPGPEPEPEPGPDVALVAADAFRLPFADRSFDVVHCALFLHHVPDPDIPALVGELLRVARFGVLINDLHRHPLARASIALLTRILSRSRHIRHDAPLSVARAFTRVELLRIAALAGRDRAEVRWHWAFRWTLWISAERKPGSIHAAV